MTDARLQRLEAALAKLAEEQSELAKRIARLESRESRALDSSPRERVIAFLDQFRAGEALSELSLGAWIAVCKDSGLRGALRTVQAREESHARLLGERIKELGGAPSYEVPEPTYTQVMTGSASLEIDDPETQALLRAIAQDELATLELFYATAQRMERGSGS